MPVYTISGLRLDSAKPHGGLRGRRRLRARLRAWLRACPTNPELRLNRDSTKSGFLSLYSTLLRPVAAGGGKSAGAAPKSARATFARLGM